MTYSADALLIIIGFGLTGLGAMMMGTSSLFFVFWLFFKLVED